MSLAIAAAVGLRRTSEATLPPRLHARVRPIPLPPPLPPLLPLTMLASAE